MILYEDFLKILDEEIEKSSLEYREQIKELFFTVWKYTLPRNSIAQFIDNFKIVVYMFPRNIRNEAALVLERTLAHIIQEVKI